MRAVAAIAALLLQSTVSAFVIPIKLADVSNVTAGGAALEQHTQSYFVTNITVGTPPQLFTVIVDTASSDFWIPDSLCTACTGKRLFDSKSSSSYRSRGFDPITFMSNNHFGVTEGFYGWDTLRLAQDDADMIVIPGTDVGQTLELPAAVAALDGVDGVLGLAFTTLSSAYSITPAFIRGVSQGNIAQSVFSIWLEEQWQTSDNGTHGVIYYGGYDLVHCRANRSFATLSSASYFQFTMANVYVDGFGVAKRMQTIITSTSPYIKLPSSAFMSVLTALGLNNNVPLPAKVDCNTKLILGFDIGDGVALMVTERNLILTNNDGTCTLAVLPTNSDSFDQGKHIELGIPFLRGRCTYFDTGLQRIGVADAIQH